MLNWLRKKQAVISPLVAAVFLGSLFSLFCQNCLAQLERERAPDHVVPHDDGLCPHQNKNEPAPEPAVKPCMGVCDCGDNAMLIADKHSITLIDHQGFSDGKLIMPPLADTAVFSARHITWSIGKPLQPDRACYPPLERSCVLLN
jgi:hypothetical protein